jgi:hypothetical protein
MGGMIPAVLHGGRCDGKEIEVLEHQDEWLEPERLVIGLADLLEPADPTRTPVTPVAVYRWSGDVKAGTRVFRYAGQGEA